MRYGEMRMWVAVALYLVVAGCNKRPGQQMDAGRFEGRVYHNDYLGFQITIPAEWSIQDREITDEKMRIGKKIAAGGDEAVQASLEASETRTVNLVTAFQHLQGAPVNYNSSISCVAEGVAHLPGIKTGGDYLFHAKRVLQGGLVPCAFPREVYTETVAGVEFHVLTAEMALEQTKIIKQDYYATLRKGYTLLLILSYSTDEQKQALRDILTTVRFTDQP